MLETFKNICNKTRRAYLLRARSWQPRGLCNMHFILGIPLPWKSTSINFFSAIVGRFQNRKTMWLEKTSSCFYCPRAWRGEVPAWPGVSVLLLSVLTAGCWGLRFHPQRTWFYNNYQCKKPESHRIVKKTQNHNKTTTKAIINTAFSSFHCRGCLTSRPSSFPHH